MNGIAAYQNNSVTTQSKDRLIILLYDGAIKAQDIINELNAVLDMKAGSEIAINLRKLYCFMYKRLSEANIKREPQMIRDVIKLMEELNQSWKAIAR